MEAVIGAKAQASLNYRVGQSFIGDHGLAPGGEAHKDSPYVVVGVLKPTGTVIDRVVLTDTASVWQFHLMRMSSTPRPLPAGDRSIPTTSTRARANERSPRC